MYKTKYEELKKYSINKESGELVQFDPNKVINAINKAIAHVNGRSLTVPQSTSLFTMLTDVLKNSIQREITTNLIKDKSEKFLMDNGFFEASKAFILYRASRDKAKQRSLYRPRLNVKPYEYPDVIEYGRAIQHSYWLFSEFNYTPDIQHFKTMDENRRTIVERTMLAISQIEVSVKTYWGKLGDIFPKPEMASVGAIFSESEVRHFDAYSELLNILNLNDKFNNLMDVGAIRKRVDYLQASMKSDGSKEDSAKQLMLFSLFIEHVSLFSQFAIIRSFDKFDNKFPGMSNVIQATAVEEQIHGDFGIALVKLMVEEDPSLLNTDMVHSITNMVIDAYSAEKDIIDWIMVEDLPWLTKLDLYDYIKYRYNQSLNAVGIKSVFEVENNPCDWFDESVVLKIKSDVFNKVSNQYDKFSTSITVDSIFNDN